MKLTFGNLIAKNFLSFDYLEFNYDSLDGMTLITGKNNDIPGSKNGIGKSNLFKVLVYALFGELPDRVNRVNIPNRINPDTEQTEVTLEFKVKSQKYKITRGLTKKYRAAFCKLEKISDDGSIEDLTKSSIILTQRFITDEILKTDISLFLRSMFLSADQTYNFFKLNAGQKKEFIENLFGLDYYNNLYTLIHKDTLEFEKKINIYEHDLLRLTGLIDEYKTSKASWDATSKSDLLQLKDDLTKQVNELKEYKSKIGKLTTAQKHLTDKVNKLNDAITLIKDYAEKYKLDEVSEQLRQTTASKSLKKNESISKNNELIYKNLCNNCKAVYKNLTNYSELEEEKQNLKKELSDSVKNLKVAKTKRAQYEEKLNGLNSKKSVEVEKLNDINAQLNEMRASLTICINSIDTLKNRILTIKSERNSKNPYIALINKTKENISDINKTLKEIDEKQKYLKIAESIVSQDTIKKFIVKDMLSLLNGRISYYLNKVGARYTCEFDENLNYTFITDSGETDYNNFSSGEQTRLAIATSFAFRDFMATRSGISSNILVLDEYMDSNLDSLAINGILTILKEFLSLYGQRIYVISHRQEVDSALFNNFIIVEKTNGISKIRVSQTPELE